MLFINQSIRIALFGVFFAATIVSCTKKATPYSEKKVDEDISEFRPRYEVVEDNSAKEGAKEVKIPTPQNDITRLLNEKLDTISSKNKNIRYTQGYRIIVYSGTDKDIAEKAKFTLLQLYPEMKPEVKYLQPNFRVKVGDFYDRVEAQLVYTRLKDFFPQALVIPEKISIK